MITLFQIDKSGSEIFEKDYSLALIKDKKIVYGINVPQSIKDRLIYLFNRDQLWTKSMSPKKERLRFRIRFHIAVIILLLKKAISDDKSIGEVNIQICNDIDGHFHEIRDMIYGNMLKMLPALKKEDILQTRFPKTSLVDIAARNLRERNMKEISDYRIPKIDIEELVDIVKK